MKYTVLINMAGIYDAGLVDKTDWNDWAILEYVRDWQAHSSAIRYGDHVWLNYKNLMAEIPMLTFKSKSGITTRIARLRDLDLISTLQTDDNRLFVRVTDFYLSVVGFRPGEKIVDTVQPRPLKREQGVLSAEQGVLSAEQGVLSAEQGVLSAEQGVLSAEHSINNNINNKKQTKPLAGDAAQDEGESFSDDQVFESPLEWSQFFIRECGYPFGIVQTARTIPMFAQWVKDSVTVGDVRMAIIAANAYNGGLIPDNPMLYGKFLRSVLNEKQRLSEEAAFTARTDVGRASQRIEEWAKIPRNDNDLCSWAAKHGYSEPRPGEWYREYRSRLQEEVEYRQSQAAANHG